MFWAVYFIVTAYFQLFGVISAHAFLNLTLCLFVFFPFPKNFPHKRLIEIIRSVISIILGVVLLWHESYLPSPLTFWNFLVNQELRPSPIFIWNFLISELNLKVLVFLIPTLIAAYVLSYTKLKKYFPVFFILIFLIIGFTEKTNLDTDLTSNFYKQESQKVIKLTDDSDNDFDIVFLQLCSFSWDDFAYTGYNMQPFLSKFDYVFTNFNSATSYSNPAVIRLMRATCGQTNQETLFSDVNDACYLMTNLKSLDYSTYTVLNHDGVYSGFDEAISKYGRADKPLDNSSLSPVQTSFDGTPIYDDADALSLWLRTREIDSNKKAVLFYNSITLHTGSKYLNNDYLSNTDQYLVSLKNLTTDLDSFFAKLEKSNKRTIVVVLGEHGAALRGSALQPGTVREIPLPAITKVPVAIKVFGPEFNEQAGAQIKIEQGSSYFSLMELLSQIIKTKKIDAINLPATELVSDNENNIVVENDLGLFYRLKKYKTWNLIPGFISAKK